MKKLILALLLINLTGCAGVLAPVANYFDSQDRCQTKSRPPNIPAPNYCGAGGTTLFVNRPLGGNMYVITK